MNQLIEVTKAEIDNAMLISGEYKKIGDKYYIRRGMLDGHIDIKIECPKEKYIMYEDFDTEKTKVAIKTLLWSYLPDGATLKEADEIAHEILLRIRDLHIKYNKKMN